MEPVAFIEVLDRRGHVAQRVRIDRFPGTIGRGYRNTVVVDDGYICPEHARLSVADDGSLILEDLGSVNGMWVSARREPVIRLPIGGRIEVRLGHTLLRLIGSSHEVPPALADRTTGAGFGSRVHPVIGLALALAAAAATGLNSYLGEFDRVTLAKTVSGSLWILPVLAAWAGAWALASRVVSHRFRFFGHLAAGSLALLAGLGLSSLQGYLSFLFPGGWLDAAAGALGGMALIGILLDRHLALLGTMTTQSRRITALTAALALYGLVTFSSFADRAKFSTDLQIDRTLKPIRAEWLQAESLDQFIELTTSIRERVDRAAAEPTAKP